MIRNALVCGLILAFLTGCAAVGVDIPATTMDTNVELGGNNYRVVKTSVIGHSYGLKFLRFFDLWTPTYTRALLNLHKRLGKDVGSIEGKAQALANVVKEEGALDLIAFSIPRLTVRADLIEFVD